MCTRCTCRHNLVDCEIRTSLHRHRTLQTRIRSTWYAKQQFSTTDIHTYILIQHQPHNAHRRLYRNVPFATIAHQTIKATQHAMPVRNPHGKRNKKWVDCAEIFSLTVKSGERIEFETRRDECTPNTTTGERTLTKCARSTATM